MRKYLIARLRPKRDQDIIEATRDVEPGLLSDLVRDAVRAALEVSGRRVKEMAGRVRLDVSLLGADPPAPGGDHQIGTTALSSIHIQQGDLPRPGRGDPTIYCGRCSEDTKVPCY